MKKPPLISIVIPSFNKGSYIGKTLDSIFSQKFTNFEIIVQDGGSTDGTLKILEKYKSLHKNLMVSSKKDSGQTEAVNEGFSKAKGDLLCFVNADDYFVQDAFEEVARKYSENNFSYWYVGQGRVVNDDNLEIAKLVTFYKNLLLSLNSYNLLLVTNYIIQPSVFISKKAWQEFGPFVGRDRFIMEYDLWLRLGQKQMPVAINTCLSSFRVPAESFSRNYLDKILSEDIKIVRKFTKNKIILALHQIHNSMRKLIIKTI